MGKERVLVTVKTYPTLSRKYGETVCTAGIRDDGSWVRIYPVPFRRLDSDQQYSKFDWLECRLVRNTRDPRPESYRPVDQSDLVPVGHLGTANNWQERRRLLLRTSRVYESLSELIDGAKANLLSLAVFKPARVLDFVYEEEEARVWSSEKLRQMRELHDQLDFFDDRSWRDVFRVIPKLPYSFSYRFEDAEGRRSELQVLDWETGALFWNCLRTGGIGEPQALEAVRARYLDEFSRKDLHFFLGTTQQFHFVAPNPCVIVGVLPIPHEQGIDLFDVDHP